MDANPADQDGPDTGAGQGPLLTLDGFTGPLERLLSLARARQIDLARVSLAALVDQLATALQQAPPATPLGQKADWVVMAAWLVQLRSLLLLPVDAPARQVAEVEADQLRDRLIALQGLQALAGWLQQRPQLGDEVFARGQPEIFGISVEAGDAIDGVEFLWASLALFDNDPGPDTTSVYRPHPALLYDVAEARMRILHRLAAMPDGGSLDCFLPDPQAVCDNVAWQLLRQRSGCASTFMASLELAKQAEVILTQAAASLPIYVSSRSSAGLETGSVAALRRRPDRVDAVG